MSNDEILLNCERCGTPLIDDPDDDPTAAPGEAPICGDCERNRNFEADLEALDAQDGAIDGRVHGSDARDALAEPQSRRQAMPPQIMGASTTSSARAPTPERAGTRLARAGRS